MSAKSNKTKGEPDGIHAKLLA